MSVTSAAAVESRSPWVWDERHAVADELERTPGSERLAARMVELDPACLDDEALVEGIAAWERLAAWVAAGQARWVNALAARAESGAQVDRLPDEIATRLAITRRAAESKVELAAGLERHPLLGAALADGRLSERKVLVLLHDTEHLPRPLADAVLDRVLDTADQRTVPQLRSDVRAAELALDAAAGAARHAEARRDRCVRMVPTYDAMAWVHALLPASDAATVMTALDGVAAVREPGDERSADERRADALTAMARRVLDSGIGPDGTPLPVRQHRRPHLLISVPAVGPTGTGTALGPVVQRRDVGPVVQRGAVGPIVQLADVGPVAHLAGYGPVPTAAVVHLFSGATASQVRVDEAGVRQVTVPVTDGYRPAAELARQVVERDRTCRFPGCLTPADRCDIDHVVPFDPARPARWQTIAQNLQALCRHHHRVKTHGGWSVSRDPISGATLWRSPIGRVRLVTPEPVVPGARAG
ncbi:DUF222 domain-containing protein [Actinotalea sp.]|uniref:HNH endonuclease signature motif containing protein n=1 Tax=Actinotalea sp. TaxID=1872145 RepID=UPI0035630934